MNELIAAYNAYFRLIRADRPELLREAFRLRYQVFCEDTQIFERASFPHRIEQDEYDRRSTHVLLQHRPSGYYVGTLRLVLADPYNSAQPFPVETRAPFDSGFRVPRRLRGQIGEISRLAILRHFPHHPPRRRTRRMARASAGQAHVGPRLRFPHPVLALLVGLIQLSVERGVTHWYAIMEPGLDRLLSHLGLNLATVGAAFDFFGPCRPHFDSVDDLLHKAYYRNRKVWELITDRGALWPRPVASGSSAFEAVAC